MNTKSFHVRDNAIYAFRQRFGRAPEFIARAPGRVNLMGEHVDYNDGFVLPMAIDPAVFLAFSPSGSQQSTLLAADFQREVSLDPDRLSDHQDARGRALPGWARYPAGILDELHRQDLPAPGMLAAFASNVPRGAGLSSSAAIEMAFLKAWQELGGWSLALGELAAIGQQAESGYVGVRVGIMDQYASLAGRQGAAILLDCRAVSHREIAIPAKAAILVADSRVRHSLSGSQYNRRRETCEQALNELRRFLPGVTSLRDVPGEDFTRLEKELPADVRSIARHVVREVERTLQAATLMEQGDLTGFGRLMIASHASLRDDYHVSCAQLDLLVSIALELPGCYGARLTGAGFGGSTVNLVQASHAESFQHELEKCYRQETGRVTSITLVNPADGASVTAIETSEKL